MRSLAVLERPFDTPPPPPRAWKAAEQGYRMAMMGLYTRGGAKILAAIEAIREASDAEAHAAWATALAGLAARAEGRLADADELLAQAVEPLAQASAELSALFLALRVEGLCAAGELDRARPLAEGKAAPDLAAAIFKLATGSLTEAQKLAASARRGAADPFARAWAELLLAEVELDLDHPAEAEKILLPLLASLEEGMIDEAYVRALVLAARLATEKLWLPVGDAGGPSALRGARAAARRARLYTVNFPRYAGGLLAVQAMADALAGKTLPAEARLRKATAALTSGGLSLDLGRALARHALFHQTRGKAASAPLLAQARDLLTRAGADRRAAALAPKAEREPAAPELPGRSVLAGSMLAGSMLGGSMLAVPVLENIELKAIFEVNRAISSILDLDKLLQAILDEVVRVLKAERGALLQIVDDKVRCVAARGIDPERVREGTDEISFSVIEEVRQRGEVVLTDNAQVDARFRGRASVLASEIRSLLCAPMRTSKGLLGLLYLDSTVKSQVFRQSHVDLLSVFATQAAVAIENALAFAQIEDLNKNLARRVEERTRELAETNRALVQSLDDLRNTELRLLEAEKREMEKEMVVARSIQQSILPPDGLLRRPGVSLLGKVLPATRVGGDFWTYLELPEGRTLLFVGDVTGHGVGSGMVTAVAKACCDTLVQRLGAPEMEDLLRTLSAVIRRSTGGKLVMSAFACVVSPSTRTLTFASAGHNPPFLIETGSGAPQPSGLTAGGELLGSEAPTFRSAERPYAPGDRLVMFTDGLTEATNPNERPFGVRRLRQSLIQHFALPLPEQLGAILADCERFCDGRPRDDDLTLVLAELE
jgi:serine phosphatase RsbU (regulator of sigma subunit)